MIMYALTMIYSILQQNNCYIYSFQHTTTVNEVCIDDNGDYIASCSDDGRVRNSCFNILHSGSCANRILNLDDECLQHQQLALSLVYRLFKNMAKNLWKSATTWHLNSKQKTHVVAGNTLIYSCFVQHTYIFLFCTTHLYLLVLYNTHIFLFCSKTATYNFSRMHRKLSIFIGTVCVSR